MATKLLAILSSSDKEVALEVGLVYPLNAARNKWMDEVKVIIFGPSERTAANEPEVLACKWCADRMNVTEKLEEVGVKVVYVGQIITQLLRDGWASLTF